MTTHSNVSGVWKTNTNIYVNVSGVWKEVVNGYVNVSGVWKEVHSSGPSVIGEVYGGGYYVGEVYGQKIIAAPDFQNSATRSQAITACESYVLSGYSDWVLPTIWELEAVCAWGNTDTGSGEYQGSWYWSSTFQSPNYFYKRFPIMSLCTNSFTVTDPVMYTMSYIPIRRV